MPMRSFIAAMFLALLALTCRAADSDEIRISETRGGVRFGVLGQKPAKPAPTLFILAGTIEQSLGDAYFRQCGDVLRAQGWLCVSIDLPSHGREKRADEPPELAGWAYRISRGEPLVESTQARLKSVLDHLIAEGQTDAKRVVVCGTSRGGYMALQFMAADPRIAAAAVFCPVTDLAALTEFKDLRSNPALAGASVIQRAEALAGRAVWLVIGDADKRVGTDRAVALARQITLASKQKNLPDRMEIHVLPAAGHTTPAGSAQRAALWVTRQFQTPQDAPTP